MGAGDRGDLPGGWERACKGLRSIFIRIWPGTPDDASCSSVRIKGLAVDPFAGPGSGWMETIIRHEKPIVRTACALEEWATMPSPSRTWRGRLGNDCGACVERKSASGNLGDSNVFDFDAVSQAGRKGSMCVALVKVIAVTVGR